MRELVENALDSAESIDELPQISVTMYDKIGALLYCWRSIAVPA